ncbi:MAG: hypothetical protein WD669_12550 [Pirellulales bacterium]
MVKHLYASVLACLIVASSGLAGERRGDDAIRVFQCAFGADWDVNYDRWPDRWVRKTGPQFPHYVNIEINDDQTAGKCLRIDLDGAAAAVVSPPIRVMSRFRYILQAKLKNERLDRSSVVLTLDFYDAAGHLLQSEKTKPLATTDGWQLVQLNEIEPKDPTIERAVIGLEVIRGRKGDLQGQVSLGDVWLGRLPRISVTTNNPYNVYTALNNVTVKCELSGIRERDPEIRFQLLNSADKQLDGGSMRLNGRLISENANQGEAAVEGASKMPAVYEGSIEWKPKIPGYGYYRVVVKMLSSESAADASELDRELDGGHDVWLAVVPPFDGMESPSRGEFGWSLPKGDNPLSLDHLSRLLPQVGINWVKFPAWYDPANPRRGDELIRFVELLGASNIEVVGVIDRPPAGVESTGRSGTTDVPIADLLSPESAAAWLSSLEPVMTRLSLRVRWWQLGGDFDTSFAGYPDANKSVGELRKKLFRFGQDVRLGLCWDWDSETHVAGDVNWDFQQFCIAGPQPQEKLDSLLGKKTQNSALRWVLVEPPSRIDPQSPDRERATAEQYREFVMKLVAAKQHGADAIIVSNPFNDTNGLMRANGMPAELLMPWRTTATLLGGAKFLGSIQLPGGSENRIFVHPDGKVVMVVWSSKPAQETIYLGKKIQQYDILGNLSIPPVEKNEQVIPVGPMPTFVVGLHEAITRLRMSLTFEHQQVPSIYSRPHANELRFHNYFLQGVGGTVSFAIPVDASDERLGMEQASAEAPEAAGVLPDPLSIDPPQGAFKAAKDGDAQFPFEIRLKNAMFGKQPIRIEFNVEADENYHFSVYRELEVGTGDLTLEVKTHLEDDGALIVKQTMTNRTGRLADFKCNLSAKDRRRMRMQVYRLGEEVDTKIYRYADGQDLIGHYMLLEIEEINGGERALYHRFKVVDSPEDDEAAPSESDRAGVYSPGPGEPAISAAAGPDD